MNKTYFLNDGLWIPYHNQHKLQYILLRVFQLLYYYNNDVHHNLFQLLSLSIHGYVFDQDKVRVQFHVE